MPAETEKIGMIAGAGQFPLLFAKSAGRRGLKVYAAAHKGETDEKLSHEVERLLWIKLGQLGF